MMYNVKRTIKLLNTIQFTVTSIKMFTFKIVLSNIYFRVF